jgi:hypothetical protein
MVHRHLPGCVEADNMLFLGRRREEPLALETLEQFVGQSPAIVEFLYVDEIQLSPHVGDSAHPSGCEDAESFERLRYRMRWGVVEETADRIALGALHPRTPSS